MLPENLTWTVEHIPAKDLVHDIRVNPRNSSDAWARKQLEGYNPALLGAFIVSERITGDHKQWAILDGANRVVLMKMAGDESRSVLCNVFSGLTTEQEASVAREYNDRRSWTGIRIFQSRITEGDPIACAINRILEKHGWAIGTESGDGVLRGVKPFEQLIATAGLLAAVEMKAGRGSQQWREAMQSGTQDALRVLDEAFQVYTAAFPDRPGGYTANVIYGIAMVILKFGTRINLERLAFQIRDESKGNRYIISDARGIAQTMRLPFPDAVAYLVIRFYNKGLQRGSRAWIDDHWTKLAR